MNKRILMIVLTAAVMLAGASASRQGAQSSGVFPLCPPFCSK